MPKFVIEREIKGLGGSTAAELQAVAQKSNGVLDQLGTEIQWVHSYVTPDKMYCLYIAPNANLVHEHARRGGVPADKVVPVQSVVDPTTAED